MRQLPLGSHDIGQNIQREGQLLIQVNKFKYLGAIVINSNKLNAGLDIWISNASKALVV